MKTIEELRREFEETEMFKLYYSWQMDFDDVANTYYTENLHLKDYAECLNSAWMMFQELKK